MIESKPLNCKLSAEKIKSCKLALMIFTAVLHVCQNYPKDLPLRTKTISQQELLSSDTTHVHNLKKCLKVTTCLASLLT